MKEFIYSSLFGELVRQVKARFDAASKLHKELFDKVQFEDFLEWDTPTIGLNFEELMGKYNITVAAPTIGDNSNESVLATEGLETFANKVFLHAITRTMTVQEYRKVLSILDSKTISDETAKKELVKIMWGQVTDPVNSVRAKIDMIFLRSLSNEGKFTFDTTTNPEGGVRGQIDFNQPAANIATATTEWTEANKASVDCLEDIMAMVEKAEGKIAPKYILAAPSKIAYMLKTTKMRQAILGSNNASGILTLAQMNNYLLENELPQFKKMRRHVRVKNGTTVTEIDAWNPKNIVFVPDGKLGLVKNAYADNELKQEAGVAYSNYGRIRVSQWGVGEKEHSRQTEYTKAQSLSLPVITEIGGVYTLKTES
jgi:hypothetical protein